MFFSGRIEDFGGSRVHDFCHGCGAYVSNLILCPGVPVSSGFRKVLSSPSSYCSSCSDTGLGLYKHGAMLTLFQRVHVGITYFTLEAQSGRHTATSGPKMLYSYMDPLGLSRAAA